MTSFPKDLLEMTQEQYQEAVRYLTGRSLAELRWRQELNQKQIEIAHRERNHLGLSNLQVREHLLTEAVLLKTEGT